MELSIKFTEYELKLLWTALTHGIINNADPKISQEMSELQNKIEIIGAIYKNK